jgi:hypothetical protein
MIGIIAGVAAGAVTDWWLSGSQYGQMLNSSLWAPSLVAVIVSEIL